MTHRPHQLRRHAFAALVDDRAQRAIVATLDRMFPRGSQAAAAPQEVERLVSAPIATRALSLQPQSWNAEARTIEVVWTTGARGTRFDFDACAVVDEELATGAGNVRLDRLNRGAPVLNTHQRGDLAGQIGTVVPGSARMTSGQGVATLQLSGRPELAAIVADIAAGVIRNLSVGYTVHRYEVDPTASPRPLYRAMDWEPTEISFVPVPFDAAAQVRDQPASATPCVIRTISNKEPSPMSWITRFTRNLTGTAAPVASPAAPDQADEPSYNRQATPGWLRNYTRMMSETQGLPAELCADLALEMAERSLSEGQARDAVLQILSERQRQAYSGLDQQSGTPGGFAAGNALVFGERSYDNPTFQARAIEDALYARMRGIAPSEEARPFMAMGMVQIAGELLSRQGVRDVQRMAPNEVLNAVAWNSGGTRSYMQSRGAGDFGFHTTTDFPQLLLGAGQRFIIDVFADAGSPLKLVSRQRSSRDFRTITGVQLSGGGTLPEMPEGGEFKHGTFTERAETYKLRTFGKAFNLSRQAIINDDLGVFTDATAKMARMAAETEAQLLADLVNNNPVMKDGKPLFHADHGNLAPAGAIPTVANLDKARQGMRRQKDTDGKTPLAPAPKYIVSGIEQETTIEALMTTLQNTSVANANPFAGKLIPLVDPRLDPLAWYLFCDPARGPTLEHAYLNDQAAPVVEMQDGWDVLGTKFRVYMDFGAGAVDWRGAYKNPGSAVAG